MEYESSGDAGGDGKRCTVASRLKVWSMGEWSMEVWIQSCVWIMELGSMEYESMDPVWGLGSGSMESGNMEYGILEE